MRGMLAKVYTLRYTDLLAYPWLWIPATIIAVAVGAWLFLHGRGKSS
jgi:hypothetical protein